MKRLVFLTLFVLALGTLWSGIVFYPQKEAGEIKIHVSHVQAPELSFGGEVLQLTNQDRIANHKPRLAWSTKLYNSAKAKCQDMLTKGYWNHDSPTRKWYTFLPQGYTELGENLARDFTQPKYAEYAWMHSPEHKENILGHYNQLGAARCGNLMVVHFGYTIQ